MLERSFTKICIYSVYGLPGFINNLFIRPQIARIMIQKICLISYKLELALQGESVDVIRTAVFIILYNKIDSNHASHICIIMNYNNQYKHITVILNSLNLSLIH